MDFVFQFQLSIYALIAATMLLVKIYYRDEIYSYSSRLFKLLLFNIGFIMILEVLSWVFDGHPGSFNHVMNYTFNFLLFVFSAVVPSFWVCYIHYKIYGDIERVRKALWFQYPFFLALFLAIMNIFYPLVFKIPASTNVFERLPLMVINFIMVYGLVTYSLYIAIKERSKTRRVVLATVIAFVLLPLLASLLQLFNYGLIIMYPMMTLSAIVVYLFLETQSAATDYLTGAYSRSRFDEYVVHQVNKNEEFCVIMLDLDDYKYFNDEHGHIVGDRILIQFVRQTEIVFGDKSLVARYGGDEFVIVIPEIDIDILMKYKEELKIKIEESTDPIFKQVRFSFGYSCRTKENEFAYDKLLLDADMVMYEDKAINKNFMRRKEDGPN